MEEKDLQMGMNNDLGEYEVHDDPQQAIDELEEKIEEKQQAVHNFVLPKFNSEFNSKVSYDAFDVGRLMVATNDKLLNNDARKEYMKVTSKRRNYSTAYIREAKQKAKDEVMKIANEFFDKALADIEKKMLGYSLEDRATTQDSLLNEAKKQTALQYTLALLDVAILEDIDAFVDANSEQFEILSIILMHLKKHHSGDMKSYEIRHKINNLIRKGKSIDDLEKLQEQYEFFNRQKANLKNNKVIHFGVDVEGQKRIVNLDSLIDELDY